MKAVFVELPAFDRHRAEYLSDEWLYTVYDKDERDDLSPQQRKTLKAMLKPELEQGERHENSREAS